jgi:hypothetical protein
MGSVRAWQVVPARHAALEGRRADLVWKRRPWAAWRVLRGVEIVEYKRVMMLASLSRLSPGGLTDRLYQLRTQERALLVELLWHIAEVDRRRLYLEMAFPSLFAFATGFLGYTKAAAFRRTTASRLLARFPIVADHLADGRLNLTTLVELRDVLDESRLDEILRRAAGRTEEQVKELVAALAPRPAPVDLFRRLPAATPAAPTNVLAGSGPELAPAGSGPELAPAGSGPELAPAGSGPELAPAAPASTAGSGPELAPVGPTSTPARRGPAARLEPISEQLRVLRVTVGADFAEDLAAVRAALSHKIPDGDLAAVLHECLRVTLAAATKRRRGAGRARANAAAPTDSTSRYVPAAVRDAVWCRDDARCAFVAADGRRCDSTHQLELHHLVPFARGGAATVDGLALRCRAHNLHEARRDFGDDHVERAIARARNANHQSDLW